MTFLSSPVEEKGDKYKTNLDKFLAHVVLENETGVLVERKLESE